MKVSVIGAGNGGQAIAGYLASIGHEVLLYNRNIEKIRPVLETGGIELVGAIAAYGKMQRITDDIEEAVEYGEVLMIATTATAHASLARQMLPYLRDGQIVVLNPGRTGGALEFNHVLRTNRCNKFVHIAEAQTLIYACRLVRPGLVHIIGVKKRVLLSCVDRNATEPVIRRLAPLYTCFIPARSVLQTSLENIGAVFHPSVVIFNAATIDRGEKFYFYRDMTPVISDFIEALDAERMAVGRALGIELHNAAEWISYAYPSTVGDTLCEKMKNNPAYFDILAPRTIFSRQLLEDIPTGLLPMAELGKLAGVDVPLMDSLINMSSGLVRLDFRREGRTLESMGLAGASMQDLLNL